MGNTETAVPVSGRTGSAPLRGLDHWLLQRLHKGLAGAPLRLELGDAAAVGPPRDQAVATIWLRNRTTLLRVVLDAEMELGETYMAGDLEVHGDLVAAIEAVNRALTASGRELASRPHRWLKRQANTLHGSRSNIHHHYDIGNDFYRLWLDERLLYTCAYFPTGAEDLETAQLAKMDHVCRKLRLRPGESVVEAGCGWGALALHMAARYGVRVKAFNISREQVRYARERAARAGLAGQVEFVEADYRDIDGRFDAFVSVGMLEHVGPEHYKALGQVIRRSLSGGGRGLLHFIGRDRLRPLNAWIRRRIFPGAHPPTLRQVLDGVLEPFAMSVLDVENMRLHYARTLEHWLARFEASAGEVRRMFDEAFVRAWRLYLASSQAAFSTGYLQLFQLVFAASASNDLPWSRAELYRREQG